MNDTFTLPDIVPRFICDVHLGKLARRLRLLGFDRIYRNDLEDDEIIRIAMADDHRPDLHPMVVGFILDNHGQAVCSEMWPGNTTDVTTLIPVIKRLRNRFGIGRIYIVSDRGLPGGRAGDPADDPEGGMTLSMLSTSIVWCQELFRWKHLSEIVELSVLKGQCLDRRIPDMATMQTQVAAWAFTISSVTANPHPRPVNLREKKGSNRFTESLVVNPEPASLTTRHA